MPSGVQSFVDMLCWRWCALSVLFLLGVCSEAQETYFPPRSFGDGEFAKVATDVNAFLLKRLEEPSVFAQARNKFSETYRFLWFRTFHNPIAVRLDVQPDGTGILTIKVADGHAGFPYTVKKLVQNTQRVLSRTQTEAFRKEVEAEKFWAAPTRDRGGPDATDCDSWIFEAARNGDYHLVQRAVPNRLQQSTRVVKKLGLALAIDLGQMDIPKEDR